MTSPYKIMLLALFLLHVVCYTSAFLIDNECLAPLPCTCSSFYLIECDSKQLSAVPAFKPSTTETPILDVYLSSNHITSLPANAFLNLSTVNATDIQLYLYSNQITYIASTAFKGVEHSTKVLDLHSNNLTTIPSVINQLVSLNTLNIQDNPIYTINPTVFASIGHSLTHLNIDLHHFTTWPDELHFLRSLQTLRINELLFTNIDEHAFRGFESTLTFLTIGNSKLHKIPSAICHLTQLQTLVFRVNTALVEPIIPQCTMPNVTSLIFPSNDLTEFPNVFASFPFLTSLNLYNNKIQVIKAEDIPYSTHLTYLNLDNNLFHRIPNAINHFLALKNLIMSENKIVTIEDNDLNGLTFLTEITMLDNPITYISSHAFTNNTLLNKLDLRRTQLEYVPSVVMSLPKLKWLYLSGTPIECTCNMSYLRSWNVTSIHIDSKCESSTKTVKDFISHSLSQCP